ncbi:alpha/beta-hydrolase [Plenodomus tracheiphilus IPT5]|uniref:Alpha/beta-hydrolase n=1 Tax=Plenodomus tracheiphilus IPT5 TaxID=1408161 RepID=A0A6A7BD08_9PLEO|nr:alpha/beta-hydrolase [Plenodomus tracheiphilus IPT5]
MAASAPPQGLPLDDRSDALRIPIVTLIVFSSIFVILRLGISLKNRNYFLLTDHLLWTGYLLAIVGAVYSYKTAAVGGGKHVWDPIMTPANLEKYLHYVWVGQLLNLYGMALIKLSVCTYIFMLDFSRAFRVVIWFSVVLHLGLNFIFPSVILFGECDPISKHWDVAGTQPGSCWSATPRVVSGYSGAACNILTDLIYTMAPLIYISRVQLSKRTKWGVRAVFLLGLITTTISALKLYEMKSLNESADPTYTSVNLSIFAVAEVFVGAFTASLPPLRKTFENILRKVLPANFAGSSKNTRNSYMMQAAGSQQSAKLAVPRGNGDNESELSILPDDQVSGKGSDHAIMKTTLCAMYKAMLFVLAHVQGRPHKLTEVLGCASADHLLVLIILVTSRLPPIVPSNMAGSSKPFLRDLQFRGVVEGLTHIDSHSEPLCHFFGGVPYALPPVGPFRFQKPRPLPPCYRYGTKANPGRFTGGCGLCPQPGDRQSDGKLNVATWDEDCLQNNIWVPRGDPPAEGWPVLFWIHGGFLQWGSPNRIDCRALLSESPVKCIIVAPAYRLNIFGFLASRETFESCADSAVNLGFWDQRMALQWTYENINYFGGNASNITIGGYSAGSHSVFYQLAYDLGVPDDKAIVKRALMLSNGPGMQPKSLDEAQDQFDQLLKALDVPANLPAKEKLIRLRSLRSETLVEATNDIQLHQFRAVTDGSFVRHGLLNELSNGVFAQRMKKRGTKLIIGECSDEHHVYGTWRPPPPGFDNMLARLEADYSRDASRVLMSQYFPGRKLPAKYKSWQAAFGHIYADVQVHALERGMVNALVKNGAGNLIHRYRIEWRAKCVDKDMPPSFGASHASDMAIWFFGNGRKLEDHEKEVVARSFLGPLSQFLRDGDMKWDTEHAMQLRTLKRDGTLVVEEDMRLDEGMRLWDALKKVGATGNPAEIAKL